MLEDRLEILKILNENFNINQRELAKRANMSLGKVNSILKEFTEDNFIDRIVNNRGILYKVTDKGMKFLEENIANAKNTRLKLHEEEKKVVDKNFVYEELKDSGILYDEKKSLYDNSLKVIEAKQKHVMEDIVKRFDSIIEKIHVSNDDAKRREIIKILIKEMNNRKYILEMKMKRLSRQ